MELKDSDKINWNVVNEILIYLIENNDAKDTIEGVSKWWLTHNTGRYTEDEIQQSIKFLVSKGWLLEEKITPDIYRINEDYIIDIESYLKGKYFYNNKQSLKSIFN